MKSTVNEREREQQPINTYIYELQGAECSCLTATVGILLVFGTRKCTYKCTHLMHVIFRLYSFCIANCFIQVYALSLYSDKQGGNAGKNERASGFYLILALT